MEGQRQAIEALLEERRVFPPPAAFRERARVSDESVYAEADADPVGFWMSRALSGLTWYREPTQALDDSNPPFFKWFADGELNASVNCLDKHLAAGGGDKTAYIWVGEPGDERVITYRELHDEVNRLANVLRDLGVKKGDRVAVYLGMVPELPMALLACARIGAAHSVIFGGFSAQSLAGRINDAECEVLITADGGWRKGGIVPLKQAADDAVEDCPTIKHVLVVRRTEQEIDWVEGRDHWYHDLVPAAADWCEPERMNAEDLLFLLYTSGTTAKPKGIVHTTAGYLLGTKVTHELVFDIRDDDVYWCTADIGWVTGHSYIVYGPLQNHTTGVIYEGAPEHPSWSRHWEIVQKHKVSIYYTAPTAIRALVGAGDGHLEGYDLSSLRLLGTVGEPINPEAWMWYHDRVGGGRCPIVDTWWQTETGSILIAPLPGVIATKPGSATVPLPGIVAEIVNEQGDTEPRGGGGYLVLKRPWPSMLRTFYGEDDRYVETYWSRFGPRVYFTGDGAKTDEDGYFWLLGRVDDVINVAGHRISTTEVESALVSHPAVAEAAVIGAHDAVKGEGIAAFVITIGGVGGDELRNELREHVATTIGKIARPSLLLFTPDLPKTRSGKIMRRLLKDIAEGRELGDATTLRDPAIVQAIKQSADEQLGRTPS
ncbi:MAG: acetyl-CoA synthetase [Gaiellales bacterium]|nr:acetyl-CoA synthetase [Gaiellales bacterium]